METIQLTTEGVLVLASSEGLKKEYSNQEFNYDFPEGIKHLADHNLISALLTPLGDDLNIEILMGHEIASESYDRVIEHYLHFGYNDEMLILSHAEFTMICDDGGDYQRYRWPIKKLKIPNGGKFKLLIGVVDVSEEFEKYQAYFNVTISLIEHQAEFKANQIIEIA